MTSPVAMRRALLTLSMCVALAGCVDGPETFVLVSITAPANPQGIDLLHVTGSDEDDDSFENVFDIDGEAFPLEFTITMQGRSGTVDLVACALNSNGSDTNLLAAATNTFTVPGEGDPAPELTLELDPGLMPPICLEGPFPPEAGAQ